MKRLLLVIGANSGQIGDYARNMGLSCTVYLGVKCSSVDGFALAGVRNFDYVVLDGANLRSDERHYLKTNDGTQVTLKVRLRAKVTAAVMCAYIGMFDFAFDLIDKLLNAKPVRMPVKS
jgi:hypothetical protein